MLNGGLFVIWAGEIESPALEHSLKLADDRYLAALHPRLRQAGKLHLDLGDNSEHAVRVCLRDLFVSACRPQDRHGLTQHVDHFDGVVDEIVPHAAIRAWRWLRRRGLTLGSRG